MTHRNRVIYTSVGGGQARDGRGALGRALPVHYRGAFRANDEQKYGKDDCDGAVAGVGGLRQQRRPSRLAVEVAGQPHAQRVTLLSKL